MDFSLEGKIALITGGSRGIGRATALGLARAGADIAIASRNLPDLEKVAEEIRELGRRALAVAAHVGRMEDINNLVTRVREELGRIAMRRFAEPEEIVGAMVYLASDASQFVTGAIVSVDGGETI